MVSASALLPVRSIDRVSSAFMSSRLARTRRRVSAGSGRTLETGSGLKRAARESAVMDRADDPFGSRTPGTLPGAYGQDMRGRLTDSTTTPFNKLVFRGLRDLYVTLRAAHDLFRKPVPPRITSGACFSGSCAGSFRPQRGRGE